MLLLLRSCRGLQYGRHFSKSKKQYNTFGGRDVQYKEIRDLQLDITYLVVW